MRNPNVSKIAKFPTDEQDIFTLKIDKFTDYNVFNDHLLVNFEDEKSRNGFINSIKKNIRSSYEYKQLMIFLKIKLDMGNCLYFKNYDMKVKGLTIELHHSPFTMYDLIYIQANRFIENGWELDIDMISKEIMYDHYCGIIGLAPVSPTVHTLIHSQQLFLPIYHVVGDLKAFYEKYKHYMTNEQLDYLKKTIDMSLEFYGTKRPTILTKRYTYLEVDGIELPSKVS